MTTETETLVEERIVLLLQHLGIEQAYFAARGQNDWHGLADKYPGVFPP